MCRSPHRTQSLLGLRPVIRITTQGKWKDGSETMAHRQGAAQRGPWRYQCGQFSEPYPATQPPLKCVGSLSTSLRRNPPLRAVELLGFDCHLWGRSGVRRRGAADSTLQMWSKDWTTLSFPPSNVSSTLAHVGPHSPSDSKALATAHPSPSTKLLARRGGGGLFSSRGWGRRWHKGEGRATGLCREGGVAVMKQWGSASLRTRLGMWWCKGWGW